MPRKAREGAVRGTCTDVRWGNPRLPLPVRLNEAISAADIVQLEWWHHPVVAGWLCSGIHPEMRLVIWSHVSGLHPPEILPGFVDIPHRFLFTSPCSLEHPSLAHRFLRPDPKYDAVFSSGGFDDFPEPPRRTYAGPTRAGYVGTLNFAKLHPRFLDYIAAVNVPGFTVALVGDPTTAAALQAQAGRLGITDSLEIRGYKSDVIGELARFDIFPYLLNPLHYGTTENALLEAMAMGVVPIVLDNPAERHIVRNGETGLIITSPHHSQKRSSTWRKTPENCKCYPKTRAGTSDNAFPCITPRTIWRSTIAPFCPNRSAPSIFDPFSERNLPAGSVPAWEVNLGDSPTTRSQLDRQQVRLRAPTTCTKRPKVPYFTIQARSPATSGSDDGQSTWRRTND